MGKNYDHLYLNILKIGQDKAESGLSYDELKTELTSQGYDFENDCIELAVKQWYFDSFYHAACYEKYESWEDLDNHTGCHCIMKGQSCLTLLDYENSKRSNNIGWFALTISVLAVLYAVFHDYKGKSIQSTPLQRQPPIIQGFQPSQNTNGSSSIPSIAPGTFSKKNMPDTSGVQE